MKNKYVVLVLFLLSVTCLTIIHSQEQPAEFSGFLSTPDVIKPGALTTFTFIFNQPMDMTASPYEQIKIIGQNDLQLKTSWDGPYKCKLSYSFPNISESGTAEITLTGARTNSGKLLSDVHSSVKITH
jgi:hypothetical protein